MNEEGEKSSPTLKDWKDNFCHNELENGHWDKKSKECRNKLENIQKYLKTEDWDKKSKEAQTEEKNKDFILINNIGMNVSSITSFFYNTSHEEIYIFINENYVDPWKWFVPLSEGPFILMELQKTLNEKKDFNFHFTRTNLGFWNFF